MDVAATTHRDPVEVHFRPNSVLFAQSYTVTMDAARGARFLHRGVHAQVRVIPWPHLHTVAKHPQRQWRHLLVVHGGVWACMHEYA